MSKHFSNNRKINGWAVEEGGRVGVGELWGGGAVVWGWEWEGGRAGLSTVEGSKGWVSSFDCSQSIYPYIYTEWMDDASKANQDWGFWSEKKEFRIICFFGNWIKKKFLRLWQKINFTVQFTKRLFVSYCPSVSDVPLTVNWGMHKLKCGW